MFGIPDSFIEKFDEHFGPWSQILLVVAAIAGFLAYKANSYVSKRKEKIANEKLLILEKENRKLENNHLLLLKDYEAQKEKTADAERRVLDKVQELAVSQKQLAYLQMPRRLSKDQISAMVKTIKNYRTDDNKIKFISSMGPEETAFLDDFRTAFKEAGWKTGVPAVFPISTVGVNIEIPVRNNSFRNYTEVVERALASAGIPFTKTYREAVDEFGEDGENWVDAPTIQVGQKDYSRVSKN
ncbi:hypothetical protein [Dyadobacter fermentans]|uniref:hypothetical protein n=1 Tax=Dyadobacter fermentans TaxID=94254 RepID=UPI001CBC98B1|nr:hypothetical protein [Dyadobacter fermentans]MBZ1362040.1 hypothetical protein [Dyadobacter fermentans]